jgi:hypothetical protein
MTKKIVVPEGMLKAVCETYSDSVEVCIEKALLWLSENPIVPSHEQWEKMTMDVHKERGWSVTNLDDHAGLAIEEWQRRMFLAPEPEVPVKDLLWDLQSSTWSETEKKHNEEVIEAYRRGKASR